MIRFFRSSFFVQYFAICVTGLTLWGRAFFEAPAMPDPDGYAPLYSVLFSLVSGYPALRGISGYILVAASSIFLNRLLYSNNIVQKNSSMSGFLFIVLMSCHPQFLTIHPVNIAVLFLLLILNQLFQSYSRPDALELIYSAGFLAALGSFFYQPFILFYPFILVSLFLFGTVRWRQIVSSLFGVLTPYFFLAVYFFWFGRLITEIKEYDMVISFSPYRMMLTNPVYMVLSSVFLLAFFYTLVFVLGSRTEKTMEKRRKTFLMNWIIFFVLVSSPFTSKLAMYHIELAFITFSGLMANYLLLIRKTFWQELILLLLVAFISANNLIMLWL